MRDSTNPYIPIVPLQVFLEPLPDENLFGLISRIHHRTAQHSVKHTLAELFGSSSVIPAASLPSHLACFAHRVPGREGNDVRTWVLLTLTLFPYFNAFLTDRQSIALKNGMMNNDGRGVKGTIGLLAGRLGAAAPLRFCVDCAKDDVHLHGTPTWHRAHQLPEIAVCHIHGTLLDEVDGPAHGHLKRALFLPSLNNPTRRYAHSFIESGLADRDRALAWSFSEWSYRLLTHQRSRWLPTEIQSIYRSRLIELGLAHPNGRVRQVELADTLLEKHGGLRYTGLHGLSVRDAGQALPWLSSLVRKPRTVKHPVLHLLLLMTLFQDWNQFVTYPTGDEIEHQDAPVQSNPVDLDATLRRLLITEHQTLSGSAKILGFSVTTIRVWAQRIGIELAGLRPKHITGIKFAQIRDALGKGATIGDIARDSGVSIGSVYRVLKMNPKLVSTRKAVLFGQERTLRRQVLVDARTVNPAITAQQIRKSLCADATWLARHDGKWLKRFCRQLDRPKAASHSCVNWRARDNELSLRVQMVIEKILRATGKPTRITLSAIARAVGRVSWFEKRLDVLPRTRAVVETAIETTEAFRIRRVLWAATELQRQGYTLQPWRIKRFAGIGRNCGTAVNKAIDAIVERTFRDNLQLAQAC
jgi:hypothetical protein